MTRSVWRVWHPKCRASIAAACLTLCDGLFSVLGDPVVTNTCVAVDWGYGMSLRVAFAGENCEWPEKRMITLRGLPSPGRFM